MTDQPQPQLRQQLAEMLQDHLMWPGTACRCRHDVCGVGGSRERRIRYAQHVANELLSLPGIAIVELPEPEDSSEMDEPGQRAWYFSHDISSWGGEYPTVMDCDADMSPSIAKSIGASLIAAAVKAEEQP